MYKDADKQREANRQAKSRQRRRDSRRQPKGMTSQGTTEGMTVADEPSNVIPKQTFEEFSKTHVVATLVDVKPKRGKDIKVFEDLPSHVQETINMMSTVDGKIDKTIKANRTAIAVNYQHQFPDRFHSTGVAI